MQPLLQDAADLGCLSFARPLMNLSSIRVFARLRSLSDKRFQAKLGKHLSHDYKP